MSTPSVRIGKYPISLRADKIVRRLEDFPELVQALRDGDMPRVRFLWEQLFECDEQRTSWDVPTPKLKAAASA